MQNVSSEYKRSMREYSRNRGYIRATIGIFNLQAQKNVQVDKSKNTLLYLSNTEQIFTGQVPERIYATAEENFSKVDGSMFFAPPENTSYSIYNNGIITDDILGNIYIDFSGESYDIKGLTIDFGDYYPTDFQIETNTVTHNYKNNDKRFWVTDDAFDNTKFFIIKPQTMVNGNGRLRIFQFSCGITNTFINDDVISYSGKEFVSPITETVPSNDVSLTVKNYDLYYSPDNPESALGYMEIGQEMRVAFGYDVNGNGKIEWLPERLSRLKSWSANESSANFTATDSFDYMQGTYYKGRYRPEGISLYDLAVDVFEDAGVASYFIDSYLKEIIVQNPLPVVSHPAALQIIANAGRSILREWADGTIFIQSSFIPKMEVSVNNEAWFSHSENILKNDAKDGYANASNDYSVLDGSIRFAPQDESLLLNTGYISESVWIENMDEAVKHRLSFRLGNPLKAFPIGGYWDGEVPKITITLEATYTAFGLGINFRNTAPKLFHIATYHGEKLVDYRTVSNPPLDYTTEDAFMNFDRMEIIFAKGYPNSRIFVDNISIGDNTDYQLTRDNDLITAPVAERQNKIQEISVTFSGYKESTENVVVASEEITVPENGYEYLVYFTNASYGLMVFTNVSGNENIYAEIIESSDYYAKLRFMGISKPTVVRYSISGYEYTVEEQKYSAFYNKTGDIKTWNNPLVSTPEHAQMLEEWLASYFLGDVEYSIEWKGDPAVDANDLFELETKFGKNYIRDYENTLNFNGRWTGSMKARKVARGTYGSDMAKAKNRLDGR